MGGVGKAAKKTVAQVISSAGDITHAGAQTAIAGSTAATAVADTGMAGSRVAHSAAAATEGAGELLKEGLSGVAGVNRRYTERKNAEAKAKLEASSEIARTKAEEASAITAMQTQTNIQNQQNIEERERERQKRENERLKIEDKYEDEMKLAKIKGIKGLGGLRHDSDAKREGEG